MIKYENLLGRNLSPINSMKRHNKILTHGWALNNNYPPLSLFRKIDWSFNNEDERSWNYHKHCWGMLDALLDAHSKNINKVDLKPALVIAFDWVQKNVSSNGQPIKTVSKFAWYDMAVGLRVQRLSYLYDAARIERLLTKEQDKLLWQAIKAHQRYLEDDNNIAFHTNHGYYQAAGQIAMGRRFRLIDESMSMSMEQGILRFKNILSNQFTSEGVHKEHSPDYHRMVYQTLLSMIDANLIEDIEILDFTRQIEASLSRFMLPNQTLASFGDTESRSMYMSIEDAINHWNTPEMHYVVTNGGIGQPPINDLTVFKESGYFVIHKNPNKNDNEYKKFSYLAQTAAFHSRTHKHADDLSFVWYDRGHSILIDAGRYGYIGKAEIGTELWKQGYWYTHPHRIYCESTRAHNTLEFDGKNYPRKGVKPYGSAIGRSKVYDNGLTVLETETKHFKTIRRVRVIIYLPNQWLVIFDWFKDNLEHKHNVRQWFNFDPDLKIEKHNNSYCTQIDQNTNLYITNLLLNVKGSKIMRGVKEPRLQGWYSPAEQVFEPASSLNYELNNSSTGSIATLFTFNKLDNVFLEKNKVNLSGRRVQLFWKDGVGSHAVRLNRDADEEIHVDYEFDSSAQTDLNIYRQKEDVLDYKKVSGKLLFEPYHNFKIEVQARLVIYDSVINDYIHFKIINPYEKYYLSYDELPNPLNSKYKFQVIDIETNRWVDTSFGYRTIKEALMVSI